MVVVERELSSLVCFHLGGYKYVADLAILAPADDQ